MRTLRSGPKTSDDAKRPDGATDAQQSHKKTPDIESPHSAFQYGQLAPGSPPELRKGTTETLNDTSFAEGSPASQPKKSDIHHSSDQSSIGSNLQSYTASQTGMKNLFTCNIVNPQSGQSCGRVFEDQRTLTRHQGASVHHPEKQKFKCSLCAKEYVFATGLEKHIRDKHGDDEYPYVSDKAGDENDSEFSISGSDETEGDWDIRMSEKPDASSKTRKSEVNQRSVRSRRYQHLQPRLPLHGDSMIHPSDSHGNGVEGPSEMNAQNALASNQPLQDSTKTVLVCKLPNPKTGKVCNRIFKSAKAKWARNTLKTHQNGVASSLFSSLSERVRLLFSLRFGVFSPN